MEGGMGGFVVGTTQGAESQATQLLDFVLGRTEPPQSNGDGIGNEGLHASASHFLRPSTTASLIKNNENPVDTRNGNVETSTDNLGSLGDPRFKEPLTPSKDPGRYGIAPSPIKPAFIASHDLRALPPFAASTPKRPLRPRIRSPSPSSQDSFAGTPVSQNPEFYLATAQQFTIPIDQLGRPETLGKERSQVKPQFASIDMLPRRMGNNFGHSVLEEQARGSQSGGDDSSGRILLVGSDSSQTQSSANESMSSSQKLNSILSTTADNHIAITGDSTGAIALNGAMSTDFGQITSQEATQPAEEDPVIVRRRRIMTGGSVPATATTSATTTGPSVSPMEPEHPSVPTHCPVLPNTANISEASQIANVGSDRGNSPLDTSTSNSRKDFPDATRQTEFCLDKPTKVVIPASDSEAEDQGQESKKKDVSESLEKETELPHTPKSKRQTADTKLPHSKSIRRTGPSKIKTSKDDYVVPASSSPTKGMPVTPRKGDSTRDSSSFGLSAAKSTLRSTLTSGKADFGESDAESESEPQPAVCRGKGKTKATAETLKTRKEIYTPTKQPVERAASLQHIATPVSARRGSSMRSSSPDIDDSPEVPLAELVGRRRAPEPDQETEVSEEQTDMNVDDYQEEINPVPSTRKRKRGTNASGTKSASKKSTKKQRLSSTPPERSGIQERLRKMKGTLVFALFKGDSCYYGAEVRALVGPGRAHVKFFDNDEDDWTAISTIRSLQLNEGDIVFRNPGKRQAVVTDVSEWDSEFRATIQFTQGPRRDDYEVVDATQVRISSRAVQSDWNDRILNELDIDPATGKKPPRLTPSPSKTSLLSRSSSRQMSAREVANDTLECYGFVITLSLGDNKLKEKGALESRITRLGGVVLEDWHNLFSLEGHFSRNSKQWSIEKGDVKYAPSRDARIANAVASVERVFLISDKENKKVRYLLALALGIPCISEDWLDAIERDGYDALDTWHQYLLPAGASEVFQTRISQTIDFEWGSALQHLTEITKNKVPAKVLTGKHILCLGVEHVPLSPTKKASSNSEASRAVPKIAIGMGADRVEAAYSPRDISQEYKLEDYDYVILRDGAPYPVGEKRAAKINWVNVTWLKGCLITGRLLDRPEMD